MTKSFNTLLKKTLIYLLTNMEEKYPVTYLTREDMESIGFVTDTLTAKDMQNIADMMGESYCEGNACFWNDLEGILMDNYKLTQHDM